MFSLTHSIKTEAISAFKSIYSVKTRSFLSILGILVGTASVVAMVSGGKLATNQALKQLNALGSNLFSISMSSNVSSSSSTKTQPELDDILKVKRASSDILEIAPYAHVFSAARFEGHRLSSDIIATTEPFADLIKLSIQQGRFLSASEGRNEFCIVGEDIYKQILAFNPNPLGKQIQVSSQYFTVAGIAKHWTENSFVMADLNSSIIVPIETAKILNKYANIDSAVMGLKANANIDQLENNIRTYFAAGFPHTELYFHSAKQILDGVKKQQEVMTVFLGFIGSISLFVGGIGIMNIMLVSVVERKKEIGIRLAVGAKPSNIVLLFLIESVILTLLGGLLGVFVGVLISFIIAIAKHWDFALFLMPPLVGFCVSSMIGIFFGFFPAYKASQLDPIESLRL